MATRRRQMAGFIEDRINDLLLEHGWSPSQVHEHLLVQKSAAENGSGDERFRGEAVPSLRTIQRMAKELSPPDPSGTWSLATDETGHPGLVLDVLSSVIDGYAGEITTITNKQAEWIVRIRLARPEMPLYQVFLFTRLYVLREAYGEPMRGLDAYLAYEPWRDEAAQLRYDSAVSNGWIPKARFKDSIADPNALAPAEVIDILREESIHLLVSTANIRQEWNQVRDNHPESTIKVMDWAVDRLQEIAHMQHLRHVPLPDPEA